MPEAPHLDVLPEHLVVVRNILKKRVPDFAVWAFGSRVIGKAKKFSDLDLAVITKKPLPLSRAAALAEEFSESDLPYKVDIADWASIGEAFRRVIEARHVVIQRPSRRAA